MTGNNHLLQKVTFEIGLNSQDGAFEIQNRISNAFRSGVLSKLEQLFDANVGPGRVISIDKLEIDLGNILSTQLEADVESTLIRELNDFLSLLNEELKNQETHSTSGSFKTKSINVRWSVPGKPLFEADVKVSDSITSHFERVIRYLQTGMLSGGRRGDEPDRISVLINSILENHSEEFVQFIQTNGNRYQVIHRLVLNLSSAQLMYVAALLGCRFSGTLDERVNELAEFIRAANIDVRSIMSSRTLYFQKAEQYIWWIILVKYAGKETHSSEAAVKLGTERNFKIIGAEAESQLLAEILLITRQLSERSDFPTNGISVTKRDYHIPVILSNAIRLLEKLKSDEPLQSDKSGENLLHPVSQNTPNFKDPVSLLKNSLFTLPEKRPDDFSLNPVSEMPELDNSLYINNAGLVILAPFLKPFFKRLGFLEGNEFVSIEAQWKAAHILQHACGFTLAEGEDGWSEHALLLNKLLCGLDIHNPIPEQMELSDSEMAETEDLLKSILHHWTILSSSSVFALQSTFLQKKGRLSIIGKDWELVIERDSAVEILIDKLPWSISIIKLPWNGYSIHTQW